MASKEFTLSVHSTENDPHLSELLEAMREAAQGIHDNFSHCGIKLYSDNFHTQLRKDMVQPAPVYKLDGPFLYRNDELILVLQRSGNASAAIVSEGEMQALRHHILKLLNQAAGT